MNRYNKISNSYDFRNPQDVFKYSRLFVNDSFGFIHKDIEPNNNSFYRSRLHSTPNTLYTNYNELMSPPIRFCPLGRANYPGEPIFYSSDRISTTIAECKPKIGQFISSLEIRIQKDLLITMILGRTNRYKNENLILDEKSTELNNFLDDCFRKNVTKENSVEYYRTSTFIRTHIPNFNDGNLDSIIYPSMASELKGDNFIFTQKFINKYGKFKSLIVSQIVDKDDNGNYITKCMFKSYKLTNENDFVYGRILNCDVHNFVDEEFHN